MGQNKRRAHNFKDLAGIKFNHLTVICFSHTDDSSRTYWMCRCDCGNEKVFYSGNLKQGLSKSCGCMSVSLRQNTHVERYGVKHALLNNKIMEKMHQTNFEKYGNEIISRVPEVKQKIKTTVKDKYGVDFVFQSDIIKKKIACTNLKKYGFESPMKNKIIQDKAKNTNIEKYNVPYLTQNKKIKDKIKQTNLKKYKNICSLFGEEVRKKTIKTNMERFGTDHPMKSKIIQEKAKNTIIRRYGVPYLAQNRDISLKQAKSLNNSYTLRHWFSNEEIICIASYEKKVVEYFNKNKIDYNWQVQTFTMPSGKTYRPDCYLPDEDKWIEIKGYFRGDAKEKWDWFHKEYPNSELWDKHKLRSLGIKLK